MSRKSLLKKVVFIDDDPTTNELHRILVESMNIADAVECYETAEEALETYSEVKENVSFPNLFFVDIGLPRMDGHELSVELRALPGFDNEKSKICFLTASKDIRDLIQADSNQFDHYFWKPMDQRKMTQLLREAFGISLD